MKRDDVSVETQTKLVFVADFASFKLIKAKMSRNLLRCRLLLPFRTNTEKKKRKTYM